MPNIDHLNLGLWRIGEIAPNDLQPHYGNGFFGNVYLLALANTNR